MSKDFIDKMAKYVAFLYRQADIWQEDCGCQDKVDLFMTKLETCRDICTMFDCRVEVWRAAREIYNFEEGIHE